MDVESQRTDIFHITYESQREIAGKPTLKLNLWVDTVDKQVMGVGQVFESASSPVTVLSDVSGGWFRRVNMAFPHILLVAEGHESSALLPNDESASGLNLRMRVSLGTDWRSGVVHFEYMSNRYWHTVIGERITVNLGALHKQLQGATQAH
ncbi:DUF1842 domain-containing protein [Marinomonas transparens]|uniref:DUF1842 domain-containing protein n=1 Tax=Marinomonas transparens TaxID=2795388 RepID=A0A934MVP6_9GAMM|nr:DUF1842 domain-containing protein [Marinomonas transparens]MBJ7537279.1 DUF1842 domain-containing protein [Marinomonas transparens]